MTCMCNLIIRNFDGKFLVDKEGFVHLPGEDIASEIEALLDGPENGDGDGNVEF